MSDGSIQFFGEIDLSRGASSINTPKSFATRSDVGGAKTILVTNGDNVLKRITCVNQFTTAVNFTKISNRSFDGHKVFNTISQTNDVNSFEYPYPGTASTYINQNSLTNGRPTYATGTGLIIRWNGSNWELHNENTNVTSTIHTDDTIVPFITLPHGARRGDFFGFSERTGGQVKWELFLPRFQSIVLQKESTDKIYIQKAVLNTSCDGTITHSNGTNIVVTPINRMYKDTHKVQPLAGHSTKAAGKANKTNLNGATCFLATTSSTNDSTLGRCIVIADSAGNTIAKTMIPGFSYMKIFKKPTDTVYCEETLFSDVSTDNINFFGLDDMRFSPIAITN